MELSLADVLDGLISWSGRGQRTRVQFCVRELPGERNFQALDIEKSVRREELLARTRPADQLPSSSLACSSGNADSGSSTASVIVVARALSKSSFAFSLQGWAISSSASRHAVSKFGASINKCS